MVALLSPPVETEAAIVHALQRTVSASRLTLFLQCRLRFYFRYVQQIEKRKTAALHVGSSVHAALKAWNKARWRSAPLTLDQLEAEYLRVWQNEEHVAVDWGDEEEKQKKMGWSLVETYLRDATPPEGVVPDAVEVPVEADLSIHGLPRLIGVLDLVQAGTIVEYKTSASTPSPEKAAHLNEVQVSGYALLYREATGRTERGVQIHTLVKLKTPKLVIASMPPVTEGQKSRLFRLMESYVAGLERRDWVPSPGLQCSACEYFNECRQWR